MSLRLFITFGLISKNGDEYAYEIEANQESAVTLKAHMDGYQRCVSAGCEKPQVIYFNFFGKRISLKISSALTKKDWERDLMPRLMVTFGHQASEMK